MKAIRLNKKVRLPLSDILCICFLGLQPNTPLRSTFHGIEALVFPFLPKSFHFTTFARAVNGWKEVHFLYRIDFSRSITQFSRSRLLEKVQSLVQGEGITKLLSSFCDLRILDGSGKVVKYKRGVPPVAFISPILLNIILDDLDHEFTLSFPNLQYIRFEHEVLIPFF